MDGVTANSRIEWPNEFSIPDGDCHFDAGYDGASWRADDPEEHISPTDRARLRIVLYQKNIEAVCSSEAEVRRQIRAF
jgi:hypothetical protein